MYSICVTLPHRHGRKGSTQAGTSQKEAFGLDHVKELERGGGEGVENRIVFGGVS